MNALAAEYLGKDSFEPGVEAHPPSPPVPEMELVRRRIILSLPPKPDVELYRVNGIVIATEGNICCLTAPAKHAKSAVCAAMVSAVITDRPMDADTLGFSARNHQGRAVVYLDSEQSPHDAWQLLDRTRRRAQLDTLPPWLYFFTLAGLSPTEARRFTREAIGDAGGEVRDQSVFLDGVADLVNDVNDPGECNPFVAELHDTAIRNSCSIVCPIHFNPGTEKARGHLGSQLERKSESNLRLEKDGEAIVLYSEKQRRAPLLKDTGPRFAWSDDAGMHVSVGTVANVRQSALREAFEDVFRDSPAMRYLDLKSTVMTAMSVGERQAERKIKEAVTAGVIVKSVAGLYNLGT